MRCIDRVISGRRVSEGAGVDICRVIGQPGADYIDPVLMFEIFEMMIHLATLQVFLHIHIEDSKP